MSPLYGVMASQITGHLVTNSFESIATVTVGAGGSSTITFSSIPSTYKHLQIRYIGRSDAATGTLNLQMTHNGDTGSNYAWHRIFGNGTTAGAGGSSTQALEIIAQVPGSTIGASMFGAGVIDILDYANTSKYKTSRTLGGYEDNSGSGAAIQLFSGLWQSTSAITSIALTLNTGNFIQYSTFALYGVKG